MLDWLQGVYLSFMSATKENQFLQAAVAAWGLTVVSFFLRSVPGKAWHWMKRQTTTSLLLTNASEGTNQETFVSFMEWYNRSKWAKWSRSFMVDGKYWGDGNDGDTIGVGLGTHFFFWRGRLFWMTRTMMENNNGSYRILYQISLHMLGRRSDMLMSLIEEFRYRPKNHTIGIYQLTTDGSWIRFCDVQQRNIDTVVINRQVKNKLVDELRQFTEDRDWYSRRGLPYKKTILLEGPPGSGKSSLIRALASHFDYKLCILNLHGMTDKLLETALATAPTRSFIVMEDFDDAAASKTRKSLKRRAGDDEAISGEQINEMRGSCGGSGPPPLNDLSSLLTAFTLSGLLNALDGVVALDNKIIFMSTNVPDELDPALLRKGRIDRRIYLGGLTDVEVREYIWLMFPHEKIDPSIEFKDIMGCDLQAHYFDNRSDFASFVDAIPKKQ